METSMKLSDSEHRCFWEMFNYLDGEGCGVLSIGQVYELFMTSGLTPDVLHQILDVCGAKQGHVSKNHFFLAMKLVAAAQNKYPIVLDICYSGIELPLPRFIQQSESWRNQSQAKMYSQQQVHQHLQLQQLQQQLQKQQIHQIKQVQFQKHHVKSQISQDSGSRMCQSSRSMSLAAPNEVSQFTQFVPPGTARKQSAPVVVQPPQQPINNNIGSRPRNESAFVDVRQDKGWASFEEDQHLNQTEFQKTILIDQDINNQKDWANFSSEGRDASSVEGLDDVWCMTDEQRDYYINQFKTMQDDLRGTISGGIAKEFFEKSKLPVKELSKIWQLSDVNRDGVLTLSEFCTAMHLVVLRRNDIDLPDQLPPSLLNQLQTFPYSDILHNGRGDDSCVIDGKSVMGGFKMSSSPTSSLSSQIWNSGYSVPVESPTSSCVSSPGNKPTPVNFEFQPITFDPDSKIIQPVAVKMSPDDAPFVLDSDAASFTEESQDAMTSSVIKKMDKHDLLIDLDIEHEETATPAAIYAMLQGRPRPTPIKPSAVQNMSQDSNNQMHKKLILPPPSASLSSLAVAILTERSDVPPPPPPRLGHSRNSSLDNQLISISPDATNHIKFPPIVPPRPSSKERTLSSPEEMRKNRKKTVAKHDSLDRRDLQASIRIQKERNLVLTRVNCELNQELQEVMEQRIALEIQMEHLQG